MPISELQLLLRNSEIRFFYLSCCLGTATGEPEDLLDEVKVDEVLICKIGLPIGVEHLYDKYNRPKPEEDEILVEPKAKAPMFKEFGKGKKPPFGVRGYRVASTLKLQNKFKKAIKVKFENMLKKGIPLMLIY